MSSLKFNLDTVLRIGRGDRLELVCAERFSSVNTLYWPHCSVVVNQLSYSRRDSYCRHVYLLWEGYLSKPYLRRRTPT